MEKLLISHTFLRCIFSASYFFKCNYLYVYVSTIYCVVFLVKVYFSNHSKLVIFMAVFRIIYYAMLLSQVIYLLRIWIIDSILVLLNIQYVILETSIWLTIICYIISFVVYPSKKLANNDTIHAIFNTVFAILAII